VARAPPSAIPQKAAQGLAQRPSADVDGRGGPPRGLGGVGCDGAATRRRTGAATNDARRPPRGGVGESVVVRAVRRGGAAVRPPAGVAGVAVTRVPDDAPFASWRKYWKLPLLLTKN